MNLKILSIAALFAAAVATADAPTAPPHPERDYRAIGGGLYLMRADDFTPDENGNIEVRVYSRNGISAGGDYTFNLRSLGVPELWDETYIGGTLGELQGQTIFIDCAHRTYEVIDSRLESPSPIWRAASTLPRLAPVFKYVCAHLSR